jgi:hypothetical protein
MSQQSQTGRVTRRQVLRYGGGIAAGTASAFAGCSSILNSNSGPFESVEVKPARVVVTLTENADVDTVLLQTPASNDAALNPTSIGSDQTSVTLPLIRNAGGSGNPAGTLKTPPAGVYTVEAMKGDEVVAAQETNRLTSNPQITSVTAQTESDSGQATGKVQFTLTAQGVLPSKLTHLSLTGVPNPLDADLASMSLTGSPISRQSQTGQSQNAKLLVYPTLDNQFLIDAPPLQLSVDSYQKYVNMDTEYPQLPEPCKTRQWSGELSVTTGRGTLTAPLTYSFGGETREAGSGLSGGGYMCSNASVSANLNASNASASSANASSSGANASGNNSTQ